MANDDLDYVLKQRLRGLDKQINDLKHDRNKTLMLLESLKRYSKESDRNLDSEQLLFEPKSKEPTFKQKVLIALENDFPTGATATQLLEYCNSKWNISMKREGLSPQLSRLAQSGKIIHDGKKWRLPQSYEFRIVNQE